MSTAFYTDTQQRRVSRVVRELIQYRELLLALFWKDLRIRYRVAAMGFFWAVLHPLAMTLILTFVFTMVFDLRSARIPGIEGDYPYAVLVLCGLIPWQFLASSLNAATNSLVQHLDLVKKVYFPREIIPIATVLDWFVNLAIGFVLLVLVHLAFGGTVGLGALWWLMVFAIQFGIVIGLALLLSAMNVFFRDVKYLVDVAVMFGFYASPVFYPVSLVEDKIGHNPWLLWLYKLNPMAELIPAYRQALLGNRFPDAANLIWPAVLAVALVLLGAFVFRRSSAAFADHL